LRVQKRANEVPKRVQGYTRNSLFELTEAKMKLNQVSKAQRILGRYHENDLIFEIQV
jgi:hypothetical protein